MVVGNPANTNALIASRNAPSLDPRQFTAMTRLDHNRAVGILANHLGAQPTDVDNVFIWGNHSPTQYPDLHRATVKGLPALDQIDRAWYENDYIPTVAKRGAAIIDARGASSAASAAASSFFAESTANSSGLLNASNIPIRTAVEGRGVTMGVACCLAYL